MLIQVGEIWIHFKDIMLLQIRILRWKLGWSSMSFLMERNIHDLFFLDTTLRNLRQEITKSYDTSKKHCLAEIKKHNWYIFEEMLISRAGRYFDIPLFRLWLKWLSCCYISRYFSFYLNLTAVYPLVKIAVHLCWNSGTPSLKLTVHYIMLN